VSCAVPVVAAGVPSGFEVEFVACDGSRTRGALSRCWDVLFDQVGRPVRSFPSLKGQRSFPGWWWLSSTGTHVGYESWLERDNVMLLDADPEVVAVVSQPFWLSWTDEVANRPRRHAPDYFVRRRDGAVVVTDVRADDRIEADDAVAFAATEVACRSVGWGYRRVGAVDPVLAANLRWLAGYRHPRNRVDAVAAELIMAFRDHRLLWDGARWVGEPIAVLPTLYHLLWTGRLLADLSTRLGWGTSVIARPGSGAGAV
jgi:hypothetical protein